MLESSCLLFSPWTPDADGLWRRVVADGETAGALGQVRYREPARRSWFAWLRACRLEVLETEDAALLCSSVRSWGLLQLWDVYDAEDRRVGSIYPPSLLDGEGLRCGYTRLDDEQSGAVISPTGSLLAEFAVAAEGVLRLRFAPDLRPDPFLRMLLLADALSLQLPPPAAGGSGASRW